MKILRRTDDDYADRLRELAVPSSLFDQGIEERARGIITRVAAEGDVALSEFAERFDGVHVSPAHLAVTPAELFNASIKADKELREAVSVASKNILNFAKKSLRKNWTSKNNHGATVGEKFDAFRRVGIYIPGGTAPLVSTCLMTITLAKEAGCEEIVVCTPPGKDGGVNDALLYAARHAGATEIYKAGGAQAIAAMALGTETIRPVQKVFGPGNAFVVAAKRLLFGRVSIDLLPGPSEVLVLADDSANPKFIAADMLAQAEHGSGEERVWLITTSLKVLNGVEKELARQIPECSRREFISRALDKNGWLIHVVDLQHGIELANELAPEHCEVMVRQKKTTVAALRTAGAIFVGGHSPTVVGDYVAGPSHTLPTGGAGKAFAGLTVDQFQRRTSIVEYNATSLKKALPTIAKFTEVEGLDAHGRSAAIRAGLEKKIATAKKNARKGAPKKVAAKNGVKAANGIARPAASNGKARPAKSAARNGVSAKRNGATTKAAASRATGKPAAKPRKR
jgi:histidinol dehydrogenase